MCMEVRDAIVRYQHAERAKSELLIGSQLITTLTDYRDEQKTGATRVAVTFLEQVRSELMLAFNATSAQEFRKAGELLSEAIGQVESDEYGAASIKIGLAVSAVTTVAQMAWHVLDEHGLI